MVAGITDEGFVAKSSDMLAEEEAALRQAREELRRIADKASAESETTITNANYSRHEVPGLGRYVIPRRTGWQPLIDIIHDPVPNIDFSANVYPALDGVIGERFNSPYLLNPLDDKFESYESLRDNLAAVRNFLLETYYANTPEGMNSDKARQALNEIMTFVGNGLYNNWRYYGVIPNHHWNQPHIDLDRAREPGGRGAQYIYDCILEQQRHSNWLRPFAAVAALFGGSSLPDWKLPGAEATHFLEPYGKDIAPGAEADSPASEAARLAAIEARLAVIHDSKTLTMTAVDLDAIGNHLLYTAEHMDHIDPVSHLSEPTRRDAVEIARDILRKLKLSIGGLHVKDGLQMKPSDDMAALGAVKGVAIVYEKLLAWAKGNNDNAIFQHPSIVAANQALGQLGYLAKVEGRRMAVLAGNTNLAATITEQLQRLPAQYATAASTTLGDLLDVVGRGIDTVINRIQQVSVNGAEVGFSRENRLGSTLSDAPTAGSANQVGADEAIQRNLQAATADQHAAMAQAQRLNSQLAAQSRAQQENQAATGRGTSSANGRQALQSAKSQQRQSSAINVNAAAATQGPLTPAQQQQLARAAAVAATARASRERDEHLHQEQQQQTLINQQKANAAMAKAKATAARIDPSAIKGFSMTGVTGSLVTGGKPIKPEDIKNSIKAQAAKAQATPPAPTAPTQVVASPMGNGQPQPYVAQPGTAPTPPPRGTGRGY